MDPVDPVDRVLLPWLQQVWLVRAVGMASCSSYWVDPVDPVDPVGPVLLLWLQQGWLMRVVVGMASCSSYWVSLAPFLWEGLLCS